MATTRFKLPDVGEGLTEAELVTWHVAVHDTVAINDVLCEVETAKSLVELPSPVAGTVEEIHVPTGHCVAVGTPLISFRVGASNGLSEPAPPAPETPAPTTSSEEAGEARPATAAASIAADALSVENGTGQIERPQVLVGTGPVPTAERTRRLTPRAERRQPDTPLALISARETRESIRGVRKAMAQAMTTSAFSAPHVTEWISVDMTRAMDLVAEMRQDRAWEEVRVTPLLLVANALLVAVARHPLINARWDDENREVVHQHFVNLGIAVASPRGLLVPNIKDADQMDLYELATALDKLVATARQGRSAQEDLRDGTITITNIGAFGVDGATPILNPGESAILAFGAVRPMPWVVDSELAIRQVGHLALSFDHRLIDGELGSCVLHTTAQILNDPARALMLAKPRRGAGER
jgi:pyruvate dehydrogenase E2 component (dihydrolipoamide acetyltransferase)